MTDDLTFAFLAAAIAPRGTGQPSDQFVFFTSLHSLRDNGSRRRYAKTSRKNPPTTFATSPGISTNGMCGAPGSMW